MNVEPGPFETDVVENAFTVVDQPAAYAQAAPGNAAAIFRGMFGGVQQNIGDADRMAQALITLAALDRADLPMRAVLGSDVWAYALKVAEKGVEELKKGEALADSVNRDGVNAAEVKQRAEMLLAAL